MCVPEDLVNKVADVVIAELLGLEQLVKVRLHEVLHDVAVEGFFCAAELRNRQ